MSTNRTPEQRAATNRANSLKSTGPKTSEGKQISCFNGYRHGFTGQAIILPEKEMAAYLDFTAKMRTTYQPVGAAEEQFFYIVSDTFWRMNNLRALEFNLFSLEFHEHQDDLNVKHEEAHVALTTAYAVRDITSQLARLSLYEQRLNRTLHTNLAKLESLQKARREKHEGEMNIAAGIRQLTMAKGETWNPADDGFAFSIPEIDAAARLVKVRTEGFFVSRA
jgi:hypothetical protein